MGRQALGSDLQKQDLSERREAPETHTVTQAHSPDEGTDNVQEYNTTVLAAREPGC